MTTPPVTIRTATPDDAEQLALYVTELFAERLPVLFRRNRVLTAEDERPFIQEMLNAPGNLLLVAERAGRIVGMLDFHAHQEPQLRHGGSFGMSVAKEQRGHGTGRQLLHSLLDWVTTQRHVNRVELQVFANNPHAQRLYESLGFMTEGRKTRAVLTEDGYIDLIDMARVWTFEPREA